MPVLLRNLEHRVSIDTRRVRRAADAVLAAVGFTDSELGLLLVSDRRIRTLNARYRQKDRPTDVLAFPLTVRPPISMKGGSERKRSQVVPTLLGDVVISLPTARRQAAAFGHTVYTEVVRLLVHGVVHLMGYDHERGPRDAARMARRERLILKNLPKR